MSEQAPPSSKKEKKKPPEGLVIPPKKPKLSKAERRAQQEAQRAAKAERQQQQQQQKGNASPKRGGSPKKQREQNQERTSSAAATASSGKKVEDDKAIALFSHLPPYRDPTKHPEEFSGVALGNGRDTNLPPAVLELGLLYAQGTIRGGNARCRAMLDVFSQLIGDYSPPESVKDIRSHLDHDLLKPAFTYWTKHCRPHSVSMGNAFTFLKSAVASLERDISLDSLKEILQETIQAYVRERTEYADRAIASHASKKIVNGDVLLVYGHSEVILQLLVMQKSLGKDFRVYCVDSRPLLEGRLMLKALREAGIPCTYILLNCISYVMTEVTKVFLGAAALYSNGSVLGRVGTACVALAAARKTVLVCCETYKISNRVQLESITGNELGNPTNVYSGEPQDNLRVLNLLYDLTPSDYISGIVTEMGILPPTSVAVLLREMNPQDTTATETTVL